MAHVKPQIAEELIDIVVPFDKKIKLKDFHSDYTKYKSLNSYTEKDSTKAEDHNFANELLEATREKLARYSDVLWASKKNAVLIILQGMDTSGKDGTISHVLSEMNPQNCRVASFKVPTAEEHAHDFLWRYVRKLPEKGEIVIFNRSHYEDVLVTQVHPDYMETLPPELDYTNNKNFWGDRYKDINAFEKHLARNGVLILKFFLYISKDEQKSRLLDRLNNEDKHWKISPDDFSERKLWDKYVSAYEDVLSNTSKEYAPWLVVPGNDKKVARAIVAHAISAALEGLKLEYPKVSKEVLERLDEYKQQLETENSK